MTFYNENDRFPAEWIRNLMDKGHISHGRVDERSIADLEPADLYGYTRAHFFAGIAGWDYALRLAGWPDGSPVWTGSCPCQPFSSAGRRKGHADERHLWPAWFRLIRECRPGVVFGEQVASKDGLAWLDAVRADMEAEGYAFGAADLCAAGVGAPHIRQRLYFVACAGCCGAQPQRLALAGETRRSQGEAGERERLWDHAGNGGDTGGMANSDHPGQRAGSRAVRHERDDAGRSSANGELEYPAGNGRVQRRSEPVRRCAVCRCGNGELAHSGTRERGQGIAAPQLAEVPDSVRGFWSDCDWLPFRDGKSRPVEPGTFPLAHGVPARVGRLRAYGNAIVPQVAAEFVKSFMESGLLSVAATLEKAR